MSRFELHVSLTLAASALASLLVFYSTRQKEGKIRLPTHVDESEDALRGHDPFEVTTAVDALDGYPIDPDAFWNRVRSNACFCEESTKIFLDEVEKNCYDAIACGHSHYQRDIPWLDTGQH